jgi:RNA polymerase sigma factor (sigma-70 family)
MKRWKALRSLVVGGQRPSSTRAAERLVEKHYATVYNLAYRTLAQRQDAEDIAQQTFLRAMPRLDELAGQDAAGWLCRVAANLCIDELRRSQRRHSSGRLADETWDELASPGPFGSPEATLEQRELRLAVWRATLALPPQQRLALALREWHGMSYAQVAGALSTSVSAVETLLFRARQGFRRAYEQRLIQPTADDAGCAWCLERLSASVDDELSVAERRRVDDHVEHCPTCRFAAGELRTTSRLYALLPLFVPALPAKAALLTAISGIGAASVGSALKVAGAGAAGAAAANASGGLTDIGSAVTIGAGTAAVAGAAAGSAGTIGAGSAAAGLGSSATVVGATGLAGASVGASGAAGAGAAGVAGSSVAGSSALAGAASALGAAKSGMAAVAVAAAIGTALWSSSQPEVPTPLAEKAPLVSQADTALADLDARLGLTSHASWTSPSTVVIESDATEADAGQPADAQDAPAAVVMTTAQVEHSPVAGHARDQQEESAEKRSQAQQTVSSQARGQTDRSAEDEDSPQASEQADRVAEAEDRPRARPSELVQADGRQSTVAGHDQTEQADASESTRVGDDPSDQARAGTWRQVGHDLSAQIGSRASTQAVADQPVPGGADDESPTRLDESPTPLAAGRLAHVVATSQAGEDGPGTVQQPVSAPAGMAAPDHHAARHDPGDDDNPAD